MARIISAEDVAAVARRVGLDDLVDELIDRLRRALSDHDPDRATTIDRTGFHYHQPHLGLVEWMPAIDPGRRVSIKTVGYHPSNPIDRQAPSVLATTTLHDTTDGRLLALCESTTLTALRTGAASAIVTDILATPDAAVVGLVGCGAQAISQVHALSRVRPLRRIVANDTDPAVARSLAERLAGVVDGIEIELVDEAGLGRLVAEADVICTCTTVAPGAGPVIPESEHRPWLHINAVGADFAGKCELPPALLHEALVCPDVVGQCLAEGEAQRLTAPELGPDLATLTRNAREYLGYRRQLTVFDSTGWALEDLVVAELILSRCQELGVGTDIDLQPARADPYDPYERCRSAAPNGGAAPEPTDRSALIHGANR